MVLATGIKPEKELLKCLLKCPEASGDFCSAWTRMLYFHLFPRTSTVPVFKTKQKQFKKKKTKTTTHKEALLEETSLFVSAWEETDVSMSVLGLYQTGCQFRGVFLTELVAMGCFCEYPPYFSQTLT